MKSTILATLLLIVTSLAQAETVVTLEGVHNCCKGCTNGIIKAAADIKDVTVTAEGETVTITSKTKTNAAKAVAAINDAGYYGTPSDATAASAASTDKASKKLTSATVSSVHLCCQKCVNAMTDAVKATPGVTEYNIENKAKSFTVKGDFTESDLIASLNKAGFHGTVGK
jgi:copper chaperone CopZ